MPRYPRILHPTDLSGSGEAALEHALDLARQYGARLHILHVLDDRYVGSDFLMEHLDLQSILREVKAGVQKTIKEMVSRAPFRNVKVQTAIREGNPAEEILRYAEERKMTLIVMGTHARIGLEHLVLGSTAERVVRHSRAPVLTVRDPGAKPS